MFKSERGMIEREATEEEEIQANEIIQKKTRSLGLRK